MLQSLFDKVGPHFYDRLDMTYLADQRPTIMQRVADARPPTLGGQKVVKISSEGGYKYRLEDGSWLLIRFSAPSRCCGCTPKHIRRKLCSSSWPTAGD